MRSRVLRQVKGIERAKRGRRLSVCSVKSVNSGIGVVRGRSESEEESESKTPRLSSQSNLPKFKAKK